MYCLFDWQGWLLFKMIRSNVREGRFVYQSDFDKENTVPNLHRRYVQEYEKHSPHEKQRLSMSLNGHSRWKREGEKEDGESNREEQLLARLTRISKEEHL